MSTVTQLSPVLAAFVKGYMSADKLPELSSPLVTELARLGLENATKHQLRCLIVRVLNQEENS